MLCKGLCQLADGAGGKGCRAHVAICRSPNPNLVSGKLLGRSVERFLVLEHQNCISAPFRVTCEFPCGFWQQIYYHSTKETIKVSLSFKEYLCIREPDQIASFMETIFRVWLRSAVGVLCNTKARLVKLPFQKSAAPGERRLLEVQSSPFAGRKLGAIPQQV